MKAIKRLIVKLRHLFSPKLFVMAIWQFWKVTPVPKIGEKTEVGAGFPDALATKELDDGRGGSTGTVRSWTREAVLVLMSMLWSTYPSTTPSEDHLPARFISSLDIPESAIHVAEVRRIVWPVNPSPGIPKKAQIFLGKSPNQFFPKSCFE